MEARLTELNRNEILLYLGHRGQAIPPELEEQMERCIRTVTAAARPRLVYRRLAVRDGELDALPGLGNDLRAILRPCREAVLMAATLGPLVEQVLMRSGVTDMADAVIMDACASAAIENVCDHFEFDLRAELKREGCFLTDRFSPGYGDFPLERQNALCDTLNAARRIGLTVTENHIMIPRKSVTAVLGIAENPQPLRARGCAVCSMFLNCPYRKEGETCHG
ncbi:MAG: hypothetical protein IJ751_09715 [Oscillospiraceae bacterium]|nr:hypothetical protein [Oscillospiraceae bacterium]